MHALITQNGEDKFEFLELLSYINFCVQNNISRHIHVTCTRVLSRNFYFGGSYKPTVNTITTTVQSQEYTGGSLKCLAGSFPLPPPLDRTLIHVCHYYYSYMLLVWGCPIMCMTRLVNSTAWLLIIVN